MPFVGFSDEEVLKCPKCSSSLNTARETRDTTKDVTSRMRRCSHCGHRWGTIEVSLDLGAFAYQDRGKKRSCGKVFSEFGFKLEHLDYLSRFVAALQARVLTRTL